MKLISLLVLFWSAASFSQNYGSPELKFIGYKFIEKEAVSGTFKKIDWKFPNKGKIDEVLESATAKIDSYSIDAGNPARNSNITSGLFKKWGSQFIDVKVLKYNAKDQIAEVKISIGNISRDVFFQVNELSNKILFTASIDLIQFGLGKPFQSLAKTCATYHKGKDGVAKTWSVVDLEVSLPKIK
jgi:polyisoprenoid-binding protein YceI